MRDKRVIVSACYLVFLTTGCEKPNQTPSAAAPKSQASPPGRNYEAGPAKFDVCSLLNREEIHSIAGPSIAGSKSSGRSDGSLRISQCVYLAREPDESVSLVVTQTDSIGTRKRSAKDYWRDTFGRYRGSEGGKKEKDEGEEREDEGQPPRRIEGLGDEAFWTAGSLYVLQKDVFLRLSIGGPDSEAAKLEHSKALAALALKRL